jgi:hypothetical protein
MKILIIVSAHKSTREAITFGGLIARITQSSVTLMHVAGKGGLKAGEKILDEARQLLDRNTEVQTNLCEGKLISRVLTEIRQPGRRESDTPACC